MRRPHCDATFLDEYLTQDFRERQGLFVSKKNARTRPVIEVLDANYANRGELLFVHRHAGVDLRTDWAKEVLENREPEVRHR